MKIKNDHLLRWISELNAIPADALSERIIRALFAVEFIDDDKEFYGKTIDELKYECGHTDEMKAEVIRLADIERLEDVLGELTVIGNGDCPYCGGNMELTDYDEIRVGGDGYTTPPEYINEWEYWKCDCCEHEVSGDPQKQNLPI